METAIYCRVSVDTGSGATDRQEHACRALATARGWSVSSAWIDRDASAYRPAHRPALDGLLAALTTGALDAVIVWKLDRICRRPKDFERLWEILEANKVALVSVTEPIDTSTDLGVALVRILVSFAHLESATIGERIRAKQRALAEAGAPPAGPAYGYTDKYAAVVPEQAKIIREVAKRVLDGEPSHQVCLDLNRRGVPSPGGKQWRETTLNELLCKPRLSGQRTYHGEVVATGCWPAILTPNQTRRLQLLLADRHRERPNRRGQYLLSGLCRCGVCGCKLVATRWMERGVVYRCNPPPNGCGKVSVLSDRLEPFVVASARDHVQRLPLRPSVGERRANGRWANRTALSDPAVEGLRQLARDHYVDRIISRAEYLTARIGLLAQLHDAQDATRPTPGALQPDEAARMINRWEELTMNQRQAHLRGLIDRIDIDPSSLGRKRRYFDPERVRITWTHHSQPGPPPSGWGTEGLLGTTELALNLGVSRSSIQRAIRNGDLEATRREGRFLIAHDAIDTWVRQRQRPSSAGLPLAGVPDRPA